MKKLTLLSLSTAVVLGVAVSPFASRRLDGLERVAEDHRFSPKSESAPPAAVPFPDYLFPGIRNEKAATAAAAGAGTLAVFTLGFVAATLLRRKR